ncbi:hypothetical protein VNI00_003314 [Paramarasmius palmivorus]|uniref:F-box domain-containing protein n=1 Tax=Paramarasmius palmivorus TaxID=297713 RepID=A0AAW0DQF4_9AGAR
MTHFLSGLGRNDLEEMTRISGVRQCKSSRRSPINDIPTEIISIIFGILCERNTLSPDQNSPPMTISAVCGRWRQIALSVPGLWSRLNINFSLWEFGRGLTLARIVRTYMYRSMTKPLSLSLLWDSYQDQARVIDPSLRVLVHHSSRWQDVIMACRHDLPPDYTIMKEIRGNLPLLEVLHIEFDPDDLFEDAPALYIFGCVLSPDEFPQLPFEQLGFLLTKFSTRDFIDDMLECCPNMRGLKLDRCISIDHDDEEDPQTEISEISAPSIEDITIVADLESSLRAGLGLFLPNLETLELFATGKGAQRHSCWKVWDNTPFFQRSPEITKLTLGDLPISDTQAIHLLTCLPALRWLRIRDSGQALSDCILNRTITSTFLQRLTVERRAFDLVPRLSELFLNVLSYKFNARRLVDMVASRWDPQSDGCIHVIDVELRGDAGGFNREFQDLDSLKAAGLQVTTSMVPLGEDDGS